jgi:hypothetical protein
MIEGYDQLPFVGDETYFGKQATYIRKDDSVQPGNKHMKKISEPKM